MVTAQVPDRVGWWKFDNAADLLTADIGSALVLTGTQTSVDGPVAENLATQVGLGSYLTMAHGIAANLGGTMVNEYTVQIDFSVSAIGVWHSFIQTDNTNGSDADLFTKASNNTIGTSATGYSTNTISADTWYRMLISVKNGEFFNVYLNGELCLSGTFQDIDGRWALGTDLLVFADNDGDDAAINCSELGIWDVALDAAQALELGNATTTQLPTRKGWWKFDDSTDLTKAEIGGPLLVSGNQSAVDGPEAGNNATQLDLGNYLIMKHGIAANAGGTMVNDWSLQIDFAVPEIGKWHTFFQTNPLNTDDGDCFTKASNNTIGTAVSGYSTNAVTANKWYRMVVTAKNQDFYRIYIDGELWVETTDLTSADLQKDSRFSLADSLLIFADNDGDDETIYCSELGIWDVALSADEVAQLGSLPNNVLVTDINLYTADMVTTINTQGGTLQVSATVLPDDATDKTVTWSVTNGTGEATISNTGLLTAIADGLVTVIATANDGSNITGSLDITISNQSGISERKGWWKFDDAADLTKAEIGEPLILSGTQTAVDGPEAGNNATQLDLGNYLIMKHGMDANGGGTMVNDWSLQIDFAVPEIDKWHTFFQTDPTNTSDGDCFTKSSNNTVGTAVTGYSTNTVAANRWYRMVITAKNQDFYRIYIDGELWVETADLTSADLQMDSRFSLADSLLIFADNDGDDATIFCSELAIWDIALTAAEVNQLGSLPNAVLVTGITVSTEGGASTIETSGGTLQMIATVLPENASDPSVTWSVTNGTGEASISTSGLLTAIADGTVTVYAASNDGSSVTGSMVITISNQTGISGNPVNTVKVYPNPVVNELTVSFNSNNPTITIYNSLGIKMDEVQVQGTQARFDVSGYAHGLYFVKVNNATVVKFEK